MHLVHTYIAYRVSNICSVYRSGLLYVPDRHSYLCVRYAHQSANAVSCRGGVYDYKVYSIYRPQGEKRVARNKLRRN